MKLFRRSIPGFLCGVSLTVMLLAAGASEAQTPRVNTKGASVPRAENTTKSNLRKAGGKISKASRRVGKSLSQASRNVQKQASRTVGKKP